jgi:hypothetical protein
MPDQLRPGGMLDEPPVDLAGRTNSARLVAPGVRLPAPDAQARALRADARERTDACRASGQVARAQALDLMENQD